MDALRKDILDRKKAKGSWFDAYATELETIRLFSESGVLKFISDNSEYSPEMYNLLKKIKSDLEKKLKKNNFSKGWEN